MRTSSGLLANAIAVYGGAGNRVEDNLLADTVYAAAGIAISTRAEFNPLPFSATTSVEHYQELARTAERGKLDSLFLADSPMLWNSIGRRPAGTLEPTVLLTALAAVTRRIGLIATASTTYNEPYNLARRFATLDIISGGRAG